MLVAECVVARNNPPRRISNRKVRKPSKAGSPLGSFKNGMALVLSLWFYRRVNRVSILSDMKKCK